MEEKREFVGIYKWRCGVRIHKDIVLIPCECFNVLNENKLFLIAEAKKINACKRMRINVIIFVPIIICGY